ncbi:hypothetical protein CSV61_05905 [Sporosarcina sp. P3]|nr:hypothetical protein CSV61_05905 [Sporosarcina sp. P3]
MLLLLIKINTFIFNASLTRRKAFFIQLPFSIYFGWITIVTIANITACLVSIDWDRLGVSDVTRTMIILFFGATIVILTTIRRLGIAYALVLIWAYYGIYSKHTSEIRLNGEYPSIILSILICLALITLTIVIVVVKNYADKKSAKEQATAFSFASNSCAIRLCYHTIPNTYILLQKPIVMNLTAYPIEVN